MFDSVGFALEDFSALRFMHAAALEADLGERLALIPQLADPKNLFGTLLQGECLRTLDNALSALSHCHHPAAELHVSGRGLFAADGPARDRLAALCCS